MGKLNCHKNKVVCIVNRKKPPLDWCKLNTDGASLGNPGTARGSGIIRDSEGRWVKVFARSIGFTTSIIVKF